MKLFWKIFISIFFSFLITVSLISYVISTKQIAGEEKRVVEENKLLASFLSKEIEVGYYESKWPFESLKKLSEHKETLFWWIVRDDGTIHLADNASFMGTYAQDYFPQIFNLLGKKDVFLNRDQNYGVFFTAFKTGTKNWSFWYGFSLSQVAQRKKEIILLVTVTSISALFVLGVILYFAIKYFTKPIEELTYSAEVVGRGNLDHRVNINSKDELGQLAQSFNKMTEDLYQTTVSKEVLRESEDRYRDLVECSQDLICTHDLKGKLLSVNQWAAKTLGYDQKTLIGMNIKDGLAPEVKGQFDEYLTRIREQGSAKGLLLVQTRTGEKRLWEYNNTLRTEGVAEPIVRGMAHDVTERKKMEQALITNEKASNRLSQENTIIARIGQIISSTLDIDEVYSLFAEEVRRLIPFDRISVATINSEARTVTMAYTWGNEVDGRNQGDVFPLAHSIYEELVATRSGLLIHTEDENKLFKAYPHLLNSFRAGFRSMISVPLISKDEVIGALHFRSLKPNAYTELDLSLSERVGHQIAGAIANAKLFNEQKRAEAEKEKLIVQLQKALGEVKQLSGLLPICASCKKIRDDKGYWNQIEIYIRDRSEAEFSHGICPDCFKKLYPDIEI